MIDRRFPPAAVLLAALACAGRARAAAVYVSTAGSDSNPGTLSAPFLTIQKGVAAAAAPGDVVYVRGGVYENRERVFLRRSGAPGRPIVLTNYPGEKPVVRFVEPASGLYPRVEIQNPAAGAAAIGWIVVSGLEIDGGYDGIKFYNAHDLEIRGNDIHDSRYMGILGVGGARVTIAGNKIRRNGDPAADPGDPKLANKLHGLYATGTEYAVVDNVFDSNYSWGIQAAGYPFDKATYAGPEYAGAARWRIAGNVFARGIHRGGVVIWLPGAKDNMIENNVFYENAAQAGPGVSRGIDFIRSGSGNVVRRNSFYTRSRAAPPTISDTAGGKSYTESGSVTGEDPGFRDPDAGDFRR